MAQRQVKVKECDRDLKPVPATKTIPFAYDGVSYELDLCDRHAVQFDQAIASWTRVAREVDGPPRFFTEDDGDQWRALLEREAEHRRAVEKDQPKIIKAATLLRHGEDEDDEHSYDDEPPVFSEWGITDHAKERQLERGFTHDEVMLAATAPERAFVDRKPGYRKHIRGRVMVVVFMEHRAVVTVMFAKREDYLAHLKEQRSVSA